MFLQRAALLIDDGNYEAERDKTDGNESKDERGSVSWVERTIALVIVWGLGVWGWEDGGIGLWVTCVSLVVGHGG